MEPDHIVVRGARQHNLRGVDVSLPRYKLVVLTGVSGSGKSSLAFDTIYAEGQRRYVESLSSYARQFLGQMEKPKVDAILGLSPAIAIEQKAVSKNPRSTVGTVTEVMDYLRVLYARVGTPHCPECGRPVRTQSPQQIADQLADLPPGTRFQLLGPIARNRKGTHADALIDAHREGFVRARIDGEVVELGPKPPLLDKKKPHDIELIVDRLVAPELLAQGDADDPAASRDAYLTRLVDSVETTLRVGAGLIMVLIQPPDEAADEYVELHSVDNACAHCGISFPELSPQLFGFNSPIGMCPECNGLGTRMRVTRERIIFDPSLSLMDGALQWYGELRKKQDSWTLRQLRAIADHYNVELDTPWNELPENFRQVIFDGSGDEKITFTWGSEGEEASWSGESTRPTRGIIHEINRLFHQTRSEGMRRRYAAFMEERDCPDCDGTRLRPEARAVTVGGRSIAEVSRMAIDEVHAWTVGLGGLAAEDMSGFAMEIQARSGKNGSGYGSSGKAATQTLSPDGARLDEEQLEIAGEVLKEIRDRLRFMLNVGLHYLTLDRSAPTLSGGEGQRIRLASQVGCGLVGVLYILDEPSIGLHARDNQSLLETLMRLRDMGNTVLVVEHDEETMLASDWLVDLGPGAGVKGGEVVSAGSPEHVMADPQSMTGRYLRGDLRVTSPTEGFRRSGSGEFIRINGATLHNLRGVDVEFPLGCLISVTGVSGSGKSSLISHTLSPALAHALHGEESRAVPGKHERIEGLEHLDKVINITQDPIGRTPRSNPATYIKLFDEIRKVFAEIPEAKLRGYNPGRFSFNVAGGRCEACQGYGRRKVEMHFLADVWVMCRECDGHRFNRETLAVKFKGASIADVLDMDVQEALDFFEHHPVIARKLQTLHDVGLDYVKLGQSALTLSGGEAQRIKLSRELSKVATGRTLYILDEPTTGLHFADVQKLLDVLHRLVEAGNTVVVIEHNMDVIMASDYVIDLGPEGGDGGGLVVAQGSPEEVAEVEGSHTGKWLKRMIVART